MTNRIDDIFNEPHSYRRSLPHIQPVNAYYFVTTRLVDSIPRSILLKLEMEREDFERQLKRVKDEAKRAELKHDFERKHFKKYDEALDKIAAGPVWLGNERVAKIAMNAVKYYDGIRYELLSCCIMPNHMHLVFWMGEENVKRFSESLRRNRVSPYIVTNTMQSIKKYTAIRANRILKRSGQFWARESYDHVIRNARSLQRVVKYVLNNPVKAGLVEQPDDWKWNYCKQNFSIVV